MAADASPPAPAPSPYLSSHAAAAYLHFASADVLTHSIERLGIPHRRFGHRLLFVPGELDAWLDARTRELAAAKRARPLVVRADDDAPRTSRPNRKSRPRPKAKRKSRPRRTPRKSPARENP